MCERIAATERRHHEGRAAFDPEQADRRACQQLTATKTADGLIDPKLVLAWLMSSLGAPGF
ncbi:MAG: hypothetical protein HPM95_00265 [Alphaproteobacteria bacterium]|nr:hypothetical protein [Alphaproteobacteria bacterium]